MRIVVLNGWAASPEAWSLCRSLCGNVGARVFSYVEQMDGEPERFMDSLDGRAVVVGWSMGGSGALRLALRSPEKIGALVLVAATPRMMEERPCESEELSNADGCVWRGMSERRLAALEAGLKMTNGAGFFGLPEGRPNPFMVDSEENLARGISYLRETDLRRRLVVLAASGRADFPVHVFQSLRDGIVRPENAAFLARVFPQAVVEMVEGTEHALPVTIPERIDEAILRAAGQTSFQTTDAGTSKEG